MKPLANQYQNDLGATSEYFASWAVERAHRCQGTPSPPELTIHDDRRRWGGSENHINKVPQVGIVWRLFGCNWDSVVLHECIFELAARLHDVLQNDDVLILYLFPNRYDTAITRFGMKEQPKNPPSATLPRRLKEVAVHTVHQRK